MATGLSNPRWLGMAGLLHPLGCFAEATLHCPYPAHRHSQARLALGLHPCGWGHLATHPAVTQPWWAAHCSRPCGDKAVPSRRTCRPPRTPALFSWVGVEGREALTVARQAGPAAAAVGSRSLAAPAPPPRAESPLIHFPFLVLSHQLLGFHAAVWRSCPSNNDV